MSRSQNARSERIEYSAINTVAFNNGTGNVRFSYRIVATRKDITRHRRFEKLDTRRVRLPITRRRTIA